MCSDTLHSRFQRGVLHDRAKCARSDCAQVCRVSECPFLLLYSCVKMFVISNKMSVISDMLHFCAQRQSPAGCKYMNSGGACYTAPGQSYCSLNTADSDCFTKDSAAFVRALYEDEKSCLPVPSVSPFTLSLNCERFKETKKGARYLTSCQNEDCAQSRTSAGCAFVNSDGFCWQVALYCSVLLCVAVCYLVLSCFAVCCSVLQCVAVCCSVLQCVAHM